MLQGKHVSIWLADKPKPVFPKISSDLETDILIIGGGLAGILLAYYLQREGTNFILLESHEIGTGVSGHSSAKITSQHGLIYNELFKRDQEKGTLYGQANQEAIESYFKIIDELGINCEAKRMPAFLYAASEQDKQKILDEVEAAQKIGLPATFESVDYLPFKTYGAVRFEDQARFNPYKFIRAVAEYLKRKEAKIFENSAVRKVDYKSKPLITKTDEYKIKANKVAVLTNYPIVDPDLLFAKLIPRQSYIIAAEPTIDIPLGLYYSSEENFHSFRPHPIAGKENWLFGGELHITGREPDTVKRYENLTSWASNNFKIKKIFYRWSTHDSASLDKIPMVGKVKKNLELYIGTGFKGWGITNTMTAAKILKDLLTGKDNAYAKLYDPMRKSLLINKKIATFGVPTIARLAGGKIKKLTADVSGLKPDEGRVVEIEGEKVGVYKDDKGRLKAVSPYCKHMGCVVTFNKAEKSWDCPCHASRYKLDGEVIHSPASKDLDKINLEDK